MLLYESTETIASKPIIRLRNNVKDVDAMILVESTETIAAKPIIRLRSNCKRRRYDDINGIDRNDCSEADNSTSE